MKHIFLIISILTINIISGQDIEKINIPKRIVYNYVDNKQIDKAKKLIEDNLSNSNTYSILQKNLIIGPLLWKRFKNIDKLDEIEKNVDFHVDNIILKGKMSQNINDSKLIWDEFRKEITGQYKIRKANEDELEYYWTVIDFDIDEPLLIVETENHNYILNLLKKDLKLMWLDEAPRFDRTPNKFKMYKNGVEIDSLSEGIKETTLERVVFLSTDQELKENSSVEDVQKIMTKTNVIFDELFKNSKGSGKIMVEFEIKKKDNEIHFAVKDQIDLEIMKEFEKRVNRQKYPNSRNNPIKIQLIYKVNSFNDTE